MRDLTLPTSTELVFGGTLVFRLNPRRPAEPNWYLAGRPSTWQLSTTSTPTRARAVRSVRTADFVARRATLKWYGRSSPWSGSRVPSALRDALLSGGTASTTWSRAPQHRALSVLASVGSRPHCSPPLRRGGRHPARPGRFASGVLIGIGLAWPMNPSLTGSDLSSYGFVRRCARTGGDRAGRRRHIVDRCGGTEPIASPFDVWLHSGSLQGARLRPSRSRPRSGPLSMVAGAAVAILRI